MSIEFDFHCDRPFVKFAGNQDTHKIPKRVRNHARIFSTFLLALCWALCIPWSGILEWLVGVECWSGLESIFGVKRWAALSSIQTKPGHILENTKNIIFHFVDMGVNSYQT